MSPLPDLTSKSGTGRHTGRTYSVYSKSYRKCTIAMSLRFKSLLYALNSDFSGMRFEYKYVRMRYDSCNGLILATSTIISIFYIPSIHECPTRMAGPSETMRCRHYFLRKLSLNDKKSKLTFIATRVPPQTRGPINDICHGKFLCLALFPPTTFSHSSFTPPVTLLDR